MLRNKNHIPYSQLEGRPHTAQEDLTLLKETSHCSRRPHTAQGDLTLLKRLPAAIIDFWTCAAFKLLTVRRDKRFKSFNSAIISPPFSSVPAVTPELYDASTYT